MYLFGNWQFVRRRSNFCRFCNLIIGSFDLASETPPEHRRGPRLVQPPGARHPTCSGRVAIFWDRSGSGDCRLDLEGRTRLTKGHIQSRGMVARAAPRSARRVLFDLRSLREAPNNRRRWRTEAAPRFWKLSRSASAMFRTSPTVLTPSILSALRRRGGKSTWSRDVSSEN